MDDVSRYLLAASLLAGGAIVFMIGRKQATGTLKRNYLAGIRTTQTLANDEAWRAAHDATATPMRWAGVSGMLTGLLIAVVPMGDAAIVAVLGVGTALLLGLVLTAGVRGHRIARDLNRTREE